MAELDKKHLAGLKYRTSEKDKEGNHSPKVCALKPERLLDWKEDGSIITLVTADGQKYKVDKNAKPVKDAEKEE